MRDPKIDPHPGDVLEETRKCIDCTRIFRREVVSAVCPYWLQGREVQWVSYRSRNGEQREILIGAWRKWARKAIVVNTAPDVCTQMEEPHAG